jgi:hypothetical protein
MIFFENYTVQDKRPQHARTYTSMNISTLTLSYEYLWRTEPVDLEIHEVTIGAVVRDIPVDSETPIVIS